MWHGALGAGHPRLALPPLLDAQEGVLVQEGAFPAVDGDPALLALLRGLIGALGPAWDRLAAVWCGVVALRELGQYYRQPRTAPHHNLYRLLASNPSFHAV